jgi:hypothetical protein
MHAYIICIMFMRTSSKLGVGNTVENSLCLPQAMGFPVGTAIHLITHINNLLVLSGAHQQYYKVSMELAHDSRNYNFLVQLVARQIQQFADQLCNPILKHFSITLAGIHTLVHYINVHLYNYDR